MPIVLRSLLTPIALLVLPFTVIADNAFSIYESESDFEDVVEGAKLAIQERGMYISGTVHMDEMLKRTGKDLGIHTKIYEKAQSIEICSAVLARKMTSEDPARIVICPFVLSIYVLPGEPGKTYVAYRAIPEDEIRSSAIMAEIAEMLKEVASAAISW